MTSVAGPPRAGGQLDPVRAARDRARIAAVLLAVAFGTNTATPLLVVYRERLDLTATELTGIFGVYALGLLPALMLAGPASDRLGRRRVALPFVGLAALTSVLFVPAAGSVPLLFLARFLQGAVSGAVFSVGNAWLQDHADPAEPARAAGLASVAMNAGFSLGPLTAGLLGEFAPAPTTLPFLLHVALVVVGLLAVWPVPDVAPPDRSGRLLRLGLPAGSRRSFATVVAPSAVFVFALPAVGITLLPLLLPAGGHPVAVTGVVAGVTLGAAALVSPLARRLRSWAPAVGVVLGAGGYLLGAVEDVDPSPPVLALTAVLLGAGSGLCLASGLAAVTRLSTPGSRGAVNATFYACAYAGFGVPVVVAALVGDGDLALPFGVLAAVATAVAAWLAVAARTGRVPAP